VIITVDWLYCLLFQPCRWSVEFMERVLCCSLQAVGSSEAQGAHRGASLHERTSPAGGCVLWLPRQRPLRSRQGPRQVSAIMPCTVQGSYGSGKTGKSQGIWMVRESQGKYFLEKSGKIGATRCQIFRLKCVKFDFCWSAGAPPQTPLGELTLLSQTP